MYRKLFLVFLGLLLLPGFIFAAGYGKISGKVLDKETGEPLIGASIQIEGTVMGASTDINGQYVILNIPAGPYVLRCSQVGYTAMTIKNVRVVSDQTTSIDFKLSSQAVQVEAIEVVAERPIVNKNTTSAVTNMTAEDIKNLPIRNTQGIALLSTGIVNSNSAGVSSQNGGAQDANGLIIRGGRPDEVAFYVDGVQTTNKVGGGDATAIISNAVEEVQVMEGGYSAEYGGANAGMVRSTTKTGTAKYKAGLELRTDAWAKAGTSFLNTYAYGRNDYSLQVSGPIIADDPKYRFFLAGQMVNQTNQPNWIPELNIQNLVDNNVNAAGGHDSISLYWPARVNAKNAYQYQYRFMGNVLLDIKPFQIRVSGTHRYLNNNNGNGYQYLYNGDRISVTEGYEQTLNLKLTHFLTPTTFYNVNLNYFNQFQETYDNIYKHDFLAYGDSTEASKYGITMRSLNGAWTDPNNYAIWDWTIYRQGYRPTNYTKIHRSYIGGAFDLTHQIGITHEIKAGGEFRRDTYRSYQFVATTEANIRANPDLSLQGIDNSLRPASYGYDFWGNDLNSGVDGAKHPIFAAAYLQDKMEFSDIVLNLGLRYDYIDADGWDLVDKTNVKFDSDKLIALDQFVKTPAHQYISPRIGFSFALTDKSIFYAQWGRFVQQSKLRDMYLGRDYVSRIVQGGNAYVNPIGFGLTPERTVQYDIGFKQQIGENLGVDIQAYYKDIKDQVAAGFQVVSPASTYGSYYMLQNLDFATVKGVEFKLNLRRTDRIAAELSYTFSDARGTGSGAQYSERFYIIWQAPTYNGQFIMPTFVMPLDFNYPHKGNFYVDYRFGENDGGPVLSQAGVNFLFNFRSGRSYTRVDPALAYGGSRVPLEPYGNSTMPWVYTLDFTLDKTVKIGPTNVNFYIMINNLLNTRNMTDVYIQTGTAASDGWLDTEAGKSKMISSGRPADYQALYNWVNFNNWGGTPRELWLGLRVDL